MDFYSWLKAYIDAQDINDEISTFAYTVIFFSSFPHTTDKEEIISWLESLNADELCMAYFDMSWESYMNSIRQRQIFKVCL